MSGLPLSKLGICASKSRQTSISRGESSVSETRMVSPRPSHSSEPMPMADLMRPSSPSPGFGDAEVNRIIPVRPFLFQPRDEQAIALDHHLRVGRLHRELEVVEVVLARDAGKFQRALHHAERRVAESGS